MKVYAHASGNQKQQMHRHNEYCQGQTKEAKLFHFQRPILPKQRPVRDNEAGRAHDGNPQDHRRFIGQRNRVSYHPEKYQDDGHANKPELIPIESRMVSGKHGQDVAETEDGHQQA